MPEDVLVKVADVVVPQKRMRIADDVGELAESIRTNGLLHPILLRREGERLILIAGLRRLEATRMLGEATIRARVLDVGEVDALLIEIDENLMRAELTKLEHAEHVAERKKVWESLHPTTKHGGSPAKREGKGGKSPREGKDLNLRSLPQQPPTPSFAADTARRTRTSKATVARSAQIGERVCHQAKDLLRGTPVEDRQDDLLKIARLDPEKQVRIARVLSEGQATTFPRAWKMLEAERIAAEPRPLPGGPYRVLVVDPPWGYDKRDGDPTRRGVTPYATMTITDIKAIPVESMAADDAVLWLWTTNAHIFEAHDIAKAWGFQYKTLLTWNKVRVGMGDWLRGQTEHCLMCVRGKPTVVLRGETTYIEETSTTHSTKPEKFYALVESLCPGAKCELFARQSRPGWDSWGSETLEAKESA